jgi:hypothetical protein
MVRNGKNKTISMNYHPFNGLMRKRESNPIAPWKIFPPVENHLRIRDFMIDLMLELF